MRRCTIRLCLPNESPDTILVEESIRQQLSNAAHLTTIAHIECIDDMMLVEIETEAEPRGIASLLNELRTTSSVKSIEVGWGWLSAASSAPRIHTGPLYNDDPLLSTHSQSEETKEYRCSIGQVLLFTLSLAMLLVGLYLIFNGPTLIGLILCMLFGIGIVINGLPIGYGLIYQVAVIRIDHNGATIRFWLRPPVHLAWDDICEFRMRCIRYALWCHILTQRDTVLPIIFPITQFYAIKEGDILAKTIIDRASLRFVEAHGFSEVSLTETSELGSALYKRFDAR